MQQFYFILWLWQIKKETAHVMMFGSKLKTDQEEWSVKLKLKRHNQKSVN